MEKNADIQQYLDVIRRKKFHFIIPAVLVFFLAATLALILPPIYKSTATILIEAQQIPENLVNSTVTGYVEQRLQTISQIVLNRTNLLEIINRFGLYEDLKDAHTTEEIVGKMLEAIKVELITTEVRTKRSWKPVETTVAFALSYEGKEPQVVQQVVNFLASLFLEEKVKNRQEKTRTTTEFFENQLAGLRSATIDLEEQIATYKEKHLNELPELMQLNLMTMERLAREIDAKNEHVKNLINRKIYLEGQLATVQPTAQETILGGERLLSPKEELAVLRSQYLSLSASFSEHHPDVITLKKKLAAMEGEVNTREDLRQRYARLQEKESRLAHMLETYSKKYPDVIRLKREVKRLKEEIQRLSEKQTGLKIEGVIPDNPAYINLQTQISTTQMDIDSAQKEFKLLKQKYEDYRRRVESAPRVEQRYLDLQRNYTNAKSEYRETMARLQAAKEAKGLEESRMGEKFILVEPALTPIKPYKPNRLAILLLGMVLATGSGLGFGSFAEYMDHSVHRADELTEISGHTVLAVIPYLENSQDGIRKIRRRLVFAGSTIALVGIGFAVLHLMNIPLENLWLQFMDRLSTSF